MILIVLLTLVTSLLLLVLSTSFVSNLFSNYLTLTISSKLKIILRLNVMFESFFTSILVSSWTTILSSFSLDSVLKIIFEMVWSSLILTLFSMNLSTTVLLSFFEFVFLVLFFGWCCHYIQLLIDMHGFKKTPKYTRLIGVHIYTNSRSFIFIITCFIEDTFLPCL